MQERTKQNFQLAKPVFDLQGDDRLAARVLFSTLADIERIAIHAAQHSGIEGQLEDEQVHEATFHRIAEDLGGRLPTPRGVRALYEFITALEGPVAVAVHNILGESWIEGIFQFVGTLPLAPELFASVQNDEARHTSLALESEKPDPVHALPYVREMERLICQMVGDYFFIAPMIWFASMRGMGELGRQLTEAHKRACAALGVEPSGYLHEIIKCGAEVADDIEPGVVQQTQWQRSTWHIGIQGPMQTLVDVTLPREMDFAELEALVVQAVSHTLTTHPNLNRTVSLARREIYQPKDAVVGVRRVYDHQGQIMTIHVKDPDTKSVDAVVRGVKGKTWRRRLTPFPEVPDVSLIERILPRPRTSCIVTLNGCFGLTHGFAPLIGIEGAVWNIAIGAPRGRIVNLGVTADHHAVNGADLGQFCDKVSKSMICGADRASIHQS